MASLTEQRVTELLAPYVTSLVVPDDLYAKVVVFVDLLLRWNARMNLTAVREPELLVQRQVGESLFAARLLGMSASLLDVGSGAGFPGIPLKLIRPDLLVTLAESQGKKASFLREAARVLALNIMVWPHRIEALPSEKLFDVVTMRAVDNSAAVLEAAGARVAPVGSLVRYLSAGDSVAQSGWSQSYEIPVPRTTGRLVRLTRAPMFHVEQ